jgi:hypothetical protein
MGFLTITAVSNLKNSKYNIKTGLGESTETYQHTESTPIHGTGQGSCASPALWLMSSSFMMDIMEKYGNGMSIEDVTATSEEIRQFMEGFVDDVSNYANNNFHDDNLLTLWNKLQQDGKLWAGLLSSSGGKLELTKCFYYLLSWQWDKYGNPTPQPMLYQNLPNSTINIAPEGQPPQLIIQRDITDSHKTLGAYKTINGNETDHINFLRDKSDNMIELLGNGQLNRRQAKIAYNSNYIPSMAYSTPAMCISETSMYRVTMKATARFLQLLGIEKNFPRAAVFGPSQFGGIGLKQLYTESICSKVECLLCSINDSNKLGKIMQRVINWTQMLCGTEQPILESTIPISWVTNNWFMTIRDFLTKCEATIKIKHTWVPKLLRENDYVLMDKMIKLKTHTSGTDNSQ